MRDRHDATVDSAEMERIYERLASAFLTAGKDLARLLKPTKSLDKESNTSEQLLTLRQVAARLGCSYGTIRNLVDIEALRAESIYTGRGTRPIRRVSERALREYLEKISP